VEYWFACIGCEARHLPLLKLETKLHFKLLQQQTASNSPNANKLQYPTLTLLCRSEPTNFINADLYRQRLPVRVIFTHKDGFEP